MRETLKAGIAAVMLMGAVAFGANTYTGGSSSGTTSAALAFPALQREYYNLVACDVTSDKAGSKLQFISGVSNTSIIVSITNSATVPVASTNGLYANAFIIIQREGFGDHSNIVAQISAIANTNLTITPTYAGALTTNDVIFLTTTNGSKAVGAATVRDSGEAVFTTGNLYQPFYMLLDGTSAVSINNATVKTLP